MSSPRHYKGVIARSLEAVQSKLGKTTPDFALILGSGLGSFSKELQNRTELSYGEIPEFPKTTVPGHEGKLCLGTIGKSNVLAFQGRFHYYEGHSPTIVTLPLRICGLWGIKNLIVTNAAGSLHSRFRPGSLVLIKDHINLIGQNPLRGPNMDELGERFIDMTAAYDKEFRLSAQRIGNKLGMKLPEGIYAALPGPSYETPAEIQMLKALGADLVGMSTVPEVIIARHQKMRILGISCVTNYATGIDPKAGTLSHKEVLENSEKSREDFMTLLKEWISL